MPAAFETGESLISPLPIEREFSAGGLEREKGGRERERKGGKDILKAERLLPKSSHFLTFSCFSQLLALDCSSLIRTLLEKPEERRKSQN